MLHESIVDGFFEQFLPRIAALKGGLPWDDGVSITPLPEPNKTQHMKALIADAVSKGARLLNERTGGGIVKGNLMHPAVVFPVTSDMLLWEEEQVLCIQFTLNVFKLFSYQLIVKFSLDQLSLLQLINHLRT